MAGRKKEIAGKGKGRNHAPDTLETIKSDFIRDFGDAYLLFGLPRLMGHVVGLLLFEEGPLSLDDITTQLGVSKGPVSQIMARLRDHNLVVRETMPGSRKDYYRATDNIFGQAFSNHAELFDHNLDLSRRYRERLEDVDAPEFFSERVDEMNEFYALMVRHLRAFMTEWLEKRHSIGAQRA